MSPDISDIKLYFSKTAQDFCCIMLASELMYICKLSLIDCFMLSAFLISSLQLLEIATERRSSRHATLVQTQFIPDTDTLPQIFSRSHTQGSQHLCTRSVERPRPE